MLTPFWKHPNAFMATLVQRIRKRTDALGLRQVRRVIVFVVGFTVILFGLALLVLPGPAIVVVPMGIAILALEFRWAKRWMRRARQMIRSGETRFFRRSKDSSEKRGLAGKEAADA